MRGDIENIKACGMTLTEKFDKCKLLEYIEELTESNLVFHRDNKHLQDYDVERENYLWDFVIQAVELDEVKNKLLEK